ncbi:hypothetical protein LTR70_007363 [Exophiala xenobiotica]|nr:hypothetical protein LTR70_007363 [Exophiala xenobiotica]
MANETGQKLKPRRNEETDEDADDEVRTQVPTRASTQHASSSHLYSVINLTGNAQAILGNVHGLDDRFFRDPVHTDAKELVLKALYFESMRSRKEQIDARAGSPRYVEWIWSTNFATWLEGPKSFYWITGRPGSGKSTLMNHICASRRTLEAHQRSASGQKWTTLHFFFDFRAGQSAANSIEGMLRSLLYQLIRRVPDAIQHVDHALYTGGVQHGGLHGCMSNLCDALDSSTTRVCAFIDGLDELEGSTSELLEVIHRLEDRTGLKICLASRPYPVFEGGLSRYPHLAVQDHNDESIRLYAESQWANSRLDLKATLPRQLSDEVRDKANGVFLWARLATDELLRGFLAGTSVDELRQQLREMPAEVKEMYQRILDRLPQVLQSEAAVLLYIIVAATSRVTVQKLYAALDAIVRKLGSTIKILALPSYQDNDSRIAALLGDFLDFSSTNKADPRDKKFQADDNNLPVPGVVVQNSLPVLKRAIRTCVALTHETLRSFLLESTWLRSHLPQELTIDNINSCWLDLYLDELASCMLDWNDNAAALNRRFQAYIEKAGKYLFDHGRAFLDFDDEQHWRKKVFWDSYEEELMELLALWTRWTPLLPYALTEIFREIRSCNPSFAFSYAA